jgi:hypothetical protein
MGPLRRLVLSVGVAVSVIATVAVVSVGAAGGFGSSGGRFTFNDLGANVSYFNPNDGSSLNLSVDRQLFMFRPHAGGPLEGPQLMTVLSASYFVPNPDPTQPPLVEDSVFAVIPDGDFVVSTDLQTATLNTTIGGSSCEEVVPVNGVQPAKGGGGCGTGFTFPLTITATWTGTGVLGLSVSNGTSTCGGFVSTNHDQTRSAFSSNVTAAIGSVSFSGGSPFVFGSVSNSQSTEIIAGNGIISPACGGKG